MTSLAYRRLTIWAMLVLLSTSTPAMAADPREEFFESRIRPVLVGTCFRCHSDTKRSGELQIDRRETLLKGGETGPAIVPGKPDESLLIKAIRHDADVSAMPPEKDKALRPEQVADFEVWIRDGAIWPALSAKFVAEKQWSFEPVRDVPLPTVKDQAWGRTSIDPFVRAQQEAVGVAPAPEADKLTLIRRATFDLTGLPPTPADVDIFLNDPASDAFERVVDRLLKSPAYGERWGRHWLDVVRYADTAGETADYPVPLAWKYRNYVIDAFNNDKPYDEFLREQIAGDILADQGPSEKYAERVTATGYLAISRRFGFDSENYHHLTLQDTIDTLGQSVLGLSLGCARCHDHKFDAVSMKDYYALYGIFESSRYAFPGSEQKQKVRSMVPLVPPSQSQPAWRAYESRVAALGSHLASQNRGVPAAVLRSLHDIDGDFELQAPAAGGSNGVLVPPWQYEGPISVTNAAQSPFKNLYPSGKVGASIAAHAGPYHMEQAIHPRRTSAASQTVYVNLDFRAGAVDADAGPHRIAIGAFGSSPAIEVLIASTVSLKSADPVEQIAALTPNQWTNLQLVLDLGQRTVTGQIGPPGSVTQITSRPLATAWNGAIDRVEFLSDVPSGSKSPAIEYDNLGIQQAPIAPVSTEAPSLPRDPHAPDPIALAEQLQMLGGIDGDFELQSANTPPAKPWGPGPNSVVKVSPESQSPYRNLFATGDFGIRMPNRGEYDGFGLTLPGVKPDAAGKLYAAFDFRCTQVEAGGGGSWRYYLGHGPGNSAAVELFFNGSEFFRRSGDAREAITPLIVGQWYQVQLTLDLPAKTYTGTLTSPSSRTEFAGQLAAGWDGTIDYSFIDSYGHIGGVRPALDADNFVYTDQPLAAFDAAPQESTDQTARRTQIAELRKQLADLNAVTDKAAADLNDLLVHGPVAMTYGVTEGTPRDARIQLRGEPTQPGDVVPRGFPRALGGEPLGAESMGSGRLPLAQWLTRPENPLTARVMVNRIWQYHFGRGIVATPNDFGVRGVAPTHPALLDHLATEFIRSGWSIKALHRRIMLSATYCQSSAIEGSEGGHPHAGDLYVGFQRRRLDAEEIRDAILTVSGELDGTPAKEHPFPPPISWGYSQHGPFSAVYPHKQRSVYLMTQRLKRHPFLALFDGADPNATTADRLGTTVPTQALFFLNDPLIHETSLKWAERLEAAIERDDHRIDQAWRATIGRSPTSTELAEATEFLAIYQSELVAANTDQPHRRALAAYLRTLIGSNQFLHVD